MKQMVEFPKMNTSSVGCLSLNATQSVASPLVTVNATKLASFQRYALMQQYNHTELDWWKPIGVVLFIFSTSYRTIAHIRSRPYIRSRPIRVWKIFLFLYKGYFLEKNPTLCLYKHMQIYQLYNLLLIRYSNTYNVM